MLLGVRTPLYVPGRRQAPGEAFSLGTIKEHVTTLGLSLGLWHGNGPQADNHCHDEEHEHDEPVEPAVDPSNQRDYRK